MVRFDALFPLIPTYKAPATMMPAAIIMLTPKFFFPAALDCNEACPLEVLEGGSETTSVAKAGTTVTAVIVERPPSGRVVV